METRSSRSYLTPDKMDAVPKSQVRQRTVMASGARSVFNWSRLWLWAAAPHSDRASHRLRPSTSPTRHGNSDSHKELGKFVSDFSPRREAEREVPSHGKDTAWKSTPLRQQYPAARPLVHWQAMWKSASGRESTRCCSSSLICLLQSRVRGRGLPCLTPLAGGVIIGQEGGCTSPDKNGRCRDCLVWDVDKACRIELPVW